MNWLALLALLFQVHPPVELTATVDNPPMSVEDDGSSIVVNAGYGRHIWFKAAVPDRENIMLWTCWANFRAAPPYPLTEIVPHNDTAFYGTLRPGEGYAGGWAMAETMALQQPDSVPDAVFSIRGGKFVIVALNGGGCHWMVVP